MVAATGPKSPGPRKAGRALAAAGAAARSGEAALADPTVSAAVSKLRALSVPGTRCGTCGGVGHWTQLCPSTPGTRRASQRTSDVRNEYDASGRVLCRNLSVFDVTMYGHSCCMTCCQWRVVLGNEVISNNTNARQIQFKQILL
mmetsp:Transcript_4925/g.14593  ORF Transcript_4925/g.14593 Transcript_4925/m.14593 type:complete len:144 (-) Transcript_4925:102-533(-)